MKRLIFRGKLKTGTVEAFNGLSHELKISLQPYLDDEKLMTLSIFTFKDTLFLYYECINEVIDPEILVSGLSCCLEPWPGLEAPRYWVPMMDIFHYNRPVDKEHWRRKEPVHKRVARITRLKDDMYSSYIFYHFQLQEEKPSIVGNKYGIIAAHEDLLFFYHEEPNIVEKPSLYEGKLNTQNTPPNWGDLMALHFNVWEGIDESQRIWRYIDLVFDI